MDEVIQKARTWAHVDALPAAAGSLPTWAKGEQRRSAKTRLVMLILAHMTVHIWHTRKSIPRDGLPIVLGIHIIIGLIETFRFAILDLSRAPVADLLDVALCVGQSVTNAMLVRRMKRGLAYITPASYLSGAVLRPFLTFASYITASPIPHRMSISAVDGFIYTRLFIFLLRFPAGWIWSWWPSLSSASPAQNGRIRGSYARRYAVSVMMAGCMGFVMGGIGYGGADGAVPGWCAMGMDAQNGGGVSGLWRQYALQTVCNVAIWHVKSTTIGSSLAVVGVYLMLTTVLAIAFWLSHNASRETSIDSITQRHALGRKKLPSSERLQPAPLRKEVQKTTVVPLKSASNERSSFTTRPRLRSPMALDCFEHEQCAPAMDTPPLSRSPSGILDREPPMPETPLDEDGALAEPAGPDGKVREDSCDRVVEAALYPKSLRQWAVMAQKLDGVDDTSE